MSRAKKYRITKIGAHHVTADGKTYRGPRADGSLHEGFPNVIELTPDQAEGLSLRHLHLVPVDLMGEAA